MKNTITYKVTDIDDSKRDEVLSFMECIAQKWYGCSPPPTDSPIITAWQDGDVVGTLSMDFRDEDTPFALESIYDFDSIKRLITPFNRKEVVQSGRWFATVKGISHKLALGVAEYSCPRGIQYLLGEGKNRTILRMEELGFRYVVPFGILPIMENIPRDGRDYYTEGDPPKLLLMDLEYLLASTPERVLG